MTPFWPPRWAGDGRMSAGVSDQLWASSVTRVRAPAMTLALSGSSTTLPFIDEGWSPVVSSSLSFLPSLSYSNKSNVVGID